jgi:hypothetical protein
MSTPSIPSWLADLISEEGESKPMEVHERETLLSSLKVAYSPETLDPVRNRQMLDRALSADDPFAPPPDEELVAAATLRDHLDSDPLVVSLRFARKASAPSPSLESNLRNQALEQLEPSVHRRIGRRAPTLWGAFAVAAAAALWVIAKSSGGLDAFQPVAPASPLALSRSTESLFSKPFNSTSSSERIDKIAQVRERDLRYNRYAIWGLP